ncbi:MAG: hypothetical protein R3C68_03480 [Myxococcota bacterium]
MATVITKATTPTNEQIRMQTWDDVVKRLEMLMDPIQAQAGSGTAAQRYEKVRDQITPIDIDGVGVRRPMTSGRILKGEATCNRDAALLLRQQRSRRPGISCIHYLSHRATGSRRIPGVVPLRSIGRCHGPN